MSGQTGTELTEVVGQGVGGVLGGFLAVVLGRRDGGSNGDGHINPETFLTAGQESGFRIDMAGMLGGVLDAQLANVVSMEAACQKMRERIEASRVLVAGLTVGVEPAVKPPEPEEDGRSPTKKEEEKAAGTETEQSDEAIAKMSAPEHIVSVLKPIKGRAVVEVAHIKTEGVKRGVSAMSINSALHCLQQADAIERVGRGTIRKAAGWKDYLVKFLSRHKKNGKPRDGAIPVKCCQSARTDAPQKQTKSVPKPPGVSRRRSGPTLFGLTKDILAAEYPEGLTYQEIAERLCASADFPNKDNDSVVNQLMTMACQHKEDFVRSKERPVRLTLVVSGVSEEALPSAEDDIFGSGRIQASPAPEKKSAKDRLQERLRGRKNVGHAFEPDAPSLNRPKDEAGRAAWMKAIEQVVNHTEHSQMSRDDIAAVFMGNKSRFFCVNAELDPSQIRDIVSTTINDMIRTKKLRTCSPGIVTTGTF